MLRSEKIFVAGHRGLVGSAILRKLQLEGYKQIITAHRNDLDLTNQTAVERFFAKEQPQYVILAAAKVGGIFANSTYPVDFIEDNLFIQTNVISSAYQYGTKRLLFLGSSCIYPKFATQPIKEEYLLTSSLEPTNEAYAIAKIAGVKMCQAYYQQFGFDCISAMPTNLYGPNDNFNLMDSHVVPALIRKFHEAKTGESNVVNIWGTGNSKREFLYVDDLADACLFLMKQSEDAIDSAAPDRLINIGLGEDITIKKLALLIAGVVGFNGELEFDLSKPDGAPRKLLDVSRLSDLGWKAKTPLDQGIGETYQWFIQNMESTLTKFEPTVGH